MDVIIDAGAENLKAILGIDDIRDRVTKGDLMACAMTVAKRHPVGQDRPAAEDHQGVASEAGKATVTATDGHPFWLPEQGVWLRAADLKPDDTPALARRQPASALSR